MVTEIDKVNTSCTVCMCFNCGRLLIPKGTRGNCEACKHCQSNKPFVDLRQSEFCAWKKEFEKHNK